MTVSFLRALAAALIAVGLGSLTACSTTLGDLPLPGTGVPGDTIRVDAEFQEALNLAQGATVKVNGIDSGKVQDVSVEDFHARAEMLVRTDAVLRDGATARLRYTTPLGELFVDVTNPAEGPPLEDGALITLADSSTAPTVEDALSQASLLVNGGGLGDLQTVTEELNTVLGGREDTARSLLERSRDFLLEANATTQDIDRALRSLVSVSSTLRERERTINRAVREIEPAAVVLRRNTPGLTRLLRQVERFSGAAQDTVTRTREDLLRVLDQATPVLAEFAGNKATYPLSLDALVRLGNAVDGVVPGDYVSISLAVRLDGIGAPDLAGILEQLGIELPDLPDLPELPLPGGLLDGLTLDGLVRGGAR
ncbi:MCE family protein [Nocardioides sp.]|uniref:MCE family protein n=1 Tax=Nocardioides sp. TaxID=35761 RepID=UPI0023A24093|nr:MCE family protein [Nocardioides sp.]MDE0778614.1 MCE family protein [Nocardioides sp.]